MTGARLEFTGFISEPVILGPQMVADEETGVLLSSFFRMLCDAITRGLSPEGGTLDR